MYIGLERDSRLTEPVTHGTISGRPLCNFTDMLPADWPSGHQPVAYWLKEEITCLLCKKKVDDMDPLDLRDDP